VNSDGEREIPPVYSRMGTMTDAELAFVARTVALQHAGIAEEALRALADYKRDHPGSARRLFGAERAELGAGERSTSR
jgi:hypothetical protein